MKYILASTLDFGEPIESDAKPYLASQFKEKGFVVSRLDSSTLLFYCSECPSKFTAVQDFQNHLFSTHPHLERKYICELCGMAYTNYLQFQQHRSGVHSNRVERENHVCNICGKNFSHRVRLQRHVKTVHSLLRRYKCDNCQQTFKRSDTLTRHMNNNICGRKSCYRCGKILKRESNLMWHMRSCSKVLELSNHCDADDDSEGLVLGIYTFITC